jgi:two-component system, OmpR family, response regulator
MRILLVEDDAELVALITKALTRAGLEVDSVSNVSDAEVSLNLLRYAAIILEPGLADADGSGLLDHRRRRHDQIPVLILSALGGLNDRIIGLRKGASDYLVKPFAMDELIARMQALLRRWPEPEQKLLTLGNVSLEIISRQVTIAGEALFLVGREADVFELLFKRKGQTVPFDVLQDHVFGTQGVSSNAVEVYVHRLRRILADAGANVQIYTFRGVGYLMDLDKERKA